MLKSIHFANYKAFRDGDLELKPITVIMGANGVGKSSILQLLLAIQQTSLYPAQKSEAAIKLNGKKTSVGQAKNFFHMAKAHNEARVSFTFENQLLQEKLSRGYFGLAIDRLAEIAHFVHYYGTRSNISSASAVIADFEIVAGSRLGSPSRRTRNTAADALSKEKIDAVKRILTAAQSMKKDASRDSAQEMFSHVPSMSMRGNAYGKFSPVNEIKSVDVLNSFQFAYDVSSIKGSLFSLNFGLRLVEGGKAALMDDSSIAVSYVEVKSIPRIGREGATVFKFSFDRNGEVSGVNSDFIKNDLLIHYIDQLKRLLSGNRSLFRIVDPKFEQQSGAIILDFVRDIIEMSCGSVQKSFEDSKFLHVGPLRATPRRYYLGDVASSGVAADPYIDSLKDNPALVEKVNSWLKIFGLSLEVQSVKELIQRLAVKRLGFDLDLDLTDVGFGFSQVLPIIASGFLLPPDATLVIEQPEVHLHPKMQAELAGLFADIVTANRMSGKSSPRLIIETHSEYLLSRLRRLMAEQDRLSASDVALYMVDRSNDGDSTLRKIDITPYGGFEWPSEFFSTDLEDTFVYLKKAMAAKERRLSRLGKLGTE